mgnify:CR=1 FL=1
MAHTNIAAALGILVDLTVRHGIFDGIAWVPSSNWLK